MDQVRETAAVTSRQDLHKPLTEKHGEFSTCMPRVMDPFPSGYRSWYATSSLGAFPLQRQWPSQEGNNVETPASSFSIDDSSHSRSPCLLSYPSRLLDTRAVAITKVSKGNVQRSLLISTKIPTDNHPSSDYRGISAYFDHAIDIRTGDDANVEDDQKHIDTFADGVYLHCAASNSFIGVPLSSTSPPHAHHDSNSGAIIVISDDDDSENDTFIPRQTLRVPEEIHNLDGLPFRNTHDAHADQNKNQPARCSTTLQQPQGFRALSIPVSPP